MTTQRQTEKPLDATLQQDVQVRLDSMLYVDPSLRDLFEGQKPPVNVQEQIHSRRVVIYAIPEANDVEAGKAAKALHEALANACKGKDVAMPKNYGDMLVFDNAAHLATVLNVATADLGLGDMLVPAPAKGR